MFPWKTINPILFPFIYYLWPSCKKIIKFRRHFRLKTANFLGIFGTKKTIFVEFLGILDQRVNFWAENIVFLCKNTSFYETGCPQFPLQVADPPLIERSIPPPLKLRAWKCMFPFQAQNIFDFFHLSHSKSMKSVGITHNPETWSSNVSQKKICGRDQMIKQPNIWVSLYIYSYARSWDHCQIRTPANAYLRFLHHNIATIFVCPALFA